MSIWQLQEAFSSDLAPPVLATRVDSYRSVASSECSDYGSWPRVRKQRTNEVMSLTELTAAFEEANSAASTSLGGQVDLLDATTAALAEDAEAEHGGFEELDWEVLAGESLVGESAQAAVDWTAIASAAKREAEDSVLNEAAAELVSQAELASHGLRLTDSAPDTELDASELLTMLGAGADEMEMEMATETATGEWATGEPPAFLEEPPSQPPSRPKSPDTALALHIGGLGVGAAPTPPPAAPSRSAERKEWTAAEDALIRSGVETWGCKWRKIAAQLPGRSDDAVRNRWHRLQAASGEPEDASPEGVALPRRRSAAGGRQAAAAAAAAAAAEGLAVPASKPERLSWTPAEDSVIIASVDEMGHKWYRIAQRLPGRTEHAIRNRYHRLQSAAADQQHQQVLPVLSFPVMAMPVVGA